MHSPQALEADESPQGQDSVCKPKDQQPRKGTRQHSNTKSVSCSATKDQTRTKKYWQGEATERSDMNNNFKTSNEELA